MRKKDARRIRWYVERDKFHRAWRRIAQMLACITVFCTTYALMLPAITLEMEPFCGIENHEHVPGCYEPLPDSPGEQDTGLVIHSHSELCFDRAGMQICPLEEIKEHQHSDDCYQIVISQEQEEQPAEEVQLEQEEQPAEEVQPEQQIQIPEKVAETPVVLVHVHTDECYLVQRGALVCGLEESQGHTHEDTCFGYGDEPICQPEEVVEHVHTEECFEKLLLCGQEEAEGHLHGDACYEMEKILVCGIETTEELNDEQIETDVTQTETNIQVQQSEETQKTEEIQITPEEQEDIQTEVTSKTESATEVTENRILVCEKQEVVAHSHCEDCYETNETGENQLVCDLPQILAHQHSEECLSLSEEMLSCDCVDEAHRHTYECYTTWSFVCEFCAEDAGPLTDADLETAKDWEKSFADVTLTGLWPEDVLAIAKTQLDYQESEKNYEEDENGIHRGYTRYGQWWGDPYGDWNSMLVSFCLHYADVEEFPLQDSCGSWVEELEEIQCFVPADGYIPKPGDLIFLEQGREERFVESEEVTASMIAERVGIVAELVAPTEEEPAMIVVIEGDCDDQVQEVSYELDSPEIIGYGNLPEAAEGTYTCGKVNHRHDWICYDEAGASCCGQEAHKHTEACKTRIFTYEEDLLKAELKITGASGLPEDLSMKLVQVTQDSGTGDFGAMYTALGDATLHSPFFINDAVFYRMELLSGDTVWQIPEEVAYTLRVTLPKPELNQQSVGENAHLRTFALTEEAPAVIVAEEPVYEEPAAAPGLLMAAAADETLPEDIPEEPQVSARYQAEETGTVDLESETITFQTENAAIFGVALAATTQEGNFWKRVTSTSELTADGVYLIVSAEGNYALTRAGTNGTKVYVEPIKGNPDYYEIKTQNNADPGTQMQWGFTGSGTSYTVKNVAYTDYFVDLSEDVIRQESEGGFWGWGSVEADPLSLTYLAAESAWRLRDDNRNLTSSGGTSFGRTNTSNYTSSMLIFKLVNTTLEIPDDVVTAPEVGGEGQTPQKPEYDPYQTVSDGKTGDTTHEGVEGSYASDPATSRLEAQFTGDPADDGKILTDKSVVYGDDDYGAYDTYGPNTFGVTLSALGQEYLTGEQTTIETPVDVMFILDISGSMNANTVDNQGTTRTEAMVEAVNFSIKEIMDQNPNNRVGAVLFSTGTGDLLEMGRYSQANDEYLKVSDREKSWTTSGGSTLTGYFVELNSGLQKDGQAYNHTIYQTQMNGTYTQAGIAHGSQKLMNVQDTTCEVTVFEGTEQETTVKVQRQPVIILLSDGEPTHCTSNYMDVLSGPHYGDGQASASSDPVYQGVYGYYTILTANYYKRMVGIHYNTPALFYSVGMGISADGDEGVAGVDGAHYKRTVLNPTAANVARDSAINTTNTTVQMRNLLNNNDTRAYITVENYNQAFMPEMMGQIHEDVPVISNPYAGNYSYADNAYFGNYNADSLKDIFGQILAASKTVSPYGFILRGRTSLDMTDPIGVGMEVQSDPVLSYGGQNYVHTRKVTSDDGKTITYQYNYLYTATDGSNDSADLSKITVQVTTDNQGLQTVHMEVPDYVLPAYAPYTAALNDNQKPYFYYEALPVRLTYQVGLTASSELAVANLKEYGGDLVYYTNRYTDTQANVYFLPTNDNPYYNIEDDGSVDGHHGCHSTAKTDNLTGTISTSFECHHGEVDHWENGAMAKVPSISQKQGNNGMLGFSAERKVIDIPVEKKWHETGQVPEGMTVDLELYSVVNDTVTQVATMTLGQENQWQGVFERLPLLEEGGYYALRELVPEGFAATYTGEVVEIPLDGKPTRVVKVQGQNPIVEELVTVTNSRAYVLPNTGGMGTQYHTFGGVLLLAAAWMYICISGKNRKKGGGHGR